METKIANLPVLRNSHPVDDQKGNLDQKEKPCMPHIDTSRGPFLSLHLFCVCMIIIFRERGYIFSFLIKEVSFFC